MKMTGTWVKRGSTIELLDGDPRTRSTNEFGGEEQFVPPGPYLPPRPYPPPRPPLTEKDLYLERLRKRTGHADFGSTATAFEFNTDESKNGWRNRMQLEAVVEFFMNFTDPWKPRQPDIPGVNVPRKPGSSYITVDLSTGWHLVLVDSFGGRLTGAAATAVGNVVTLDGDLSKVNPNFDTIYLPNDTERASYLWPKDTARASKTYRITAVDDKRHTVTLDGSPTFKGGSSRWHIPAGVSGQLPPLRYDLGPGDKPGFDHFDGAMFIVKGGEVHNIFRWNSYSSRRPSRDEYLSSLRGNKHYDFSSFRSGESEYRNYCFKVNDVGAAGAACDCVREARFYFARPVTRDVDGKTQIRIHQGASVAPNHGCGSDGCIVSGGFYAFRSQMIALFQEDYKARDKISEAMKRLKGLITSRPAKRSGTGRTDRPSQRKSGTTASEARCGWYARTNARCRGHLYHGNNNSSLNIEAMDQ